MINVLNKNLYLFNLYLLITIINSNDIYPCNITTNIDEQNIHVQYETKTIQDGK